MLRSRRATSGTDELGREVERREREYHEREVVIPTSDGRSCDEG